MRNRFVEEELQCNRPYNLIEKLRDIIVRAADGHDVSEAGVSSVGIGDDDDPMAAISAELGGPDRRFYGNRAATGSVRARYYHNKARNHIIQVRMPKIAPELAPDSTETVQIKLHIEDRKTVWLHSDNIPWAVEYLFVQNELKGVPVVDANDPGPGGMVEAPPSHQYLLDAPSAD